MASAGGPDDHWAAEIRRFLDDALHSRLIDDTVYYRLVIELQHRTEERAAAVRSEPGSVRAGREELLWPELTVPPRASVSSQTLPPPPKASVPIVPNWWKEPQPAPEWRPQWAEWVGAVRALLASELALHGLAYLGVVLTFIGAFGFVVFAYGELDRSLRPVAEAVVPLVCFVTAWFLRRQQAPHVAAGLEFLGGLLLPLVAYASLVDDVALPPTSSERRWSRRSRWYLWRCAAATPHGRRSTRLRRSGSSLRRWPGRSSGRSGSRSPMNRSRASPSGRRTSGRWPRT